MHLPRFIWCSYPISSINKRFVFHAFHSIHPWYELDGLRIQFSYRLRGGVFNEHVFDVPPTRIKVKLTVCVIWRNSLKTAIVLHDFLFCFVFSYLYLSYRAFSFLFNCSFIITFFSKSHDAIFVCLWRFRMISRREIFY